MDKKLKFKYETPPRLTVQHAHGFWANWTGSGTILVDFVSERRPLPLSVTHDLHPEPDGGERVGEMVAQELADFIIRQVLSSIEMTPALALQLANVLAGMANQESMPAPPTQTAGGKVH